MWNDSNLQGSFKIKLQMSVKRITFSGHKDTKDRLYIFRDKT
jgi:hypothetical protein